jgi:hypothetical protein
MQKTGNKACFSPEFCYTTLMTKETKPTINWGANNVAWCRKHDKHGVCHKCNAEAFNAFIEKNEMIPIGGDLFEDAGGHVWHESNIEDEIKHQKELA